MKPKTSKSKRKAAPPEKPWMMGRPEWFARRSVGWGMTPVTWQGWLYAFVWLLLIAVPFNLLLAYDQGGPAVTWMALAATVLVLDAKKILAAMPPEPAAAAASASPAASPGPSEPKQS